MVLCYYKKRNELYYIYETGYVMRTVNGSYEKINRIFRDLNDDPLTFPCRVDARNFCFDRNAIMRI